MVENLMKANKEPGQCVAKGLKVVKGISSGAPRIISWNITLRCPLKCAHCYVDAGEREADRSALHAGGIRCHRPDLRDREPRCRAHRGEPLMREDIFAIARYGTEQGLRMVMGTSGMLIDRTTAQNSVRRELKPLPSASIRHLQPLTMHSAA